MSDAPPALAAELAAFGLRFPGTALSLARSASPPGLVIRVRGRLDTDNALDFQRLLEDSLAEAKAQGGFILELSGLDYISSTGIGALTSLLLETKRHRIRLFLARVPERAKSILDLLGFSAFFDFIEGFEGEA